MALPLERESAIDALERVVTENDDLAALEAHIGRFNVFDTLDVARTEIRHSNFLAWLLDPEASHRQGILFLRAILMDVLRKSPLHFRPFGPVELDRARLGDIQVHREWRHTDILITCEQPSFVIVIENKIDSAEHGDQLLQYEKAIAAGFQDRHSLFVFLTETGNRPSSDRWVVYSYADIYKVLDRCRRANGGLIDKEILIFLDHYLRLIGSWFMDDPKIAELCDRIYQNHRQALDLIFERVGSPIARLVSKLEVTIRRQPERWVVCHRTGREIQFVPTTWPEIFPAIGAQRNVDPRLWIRLGFWCGPDRCESYCYCFATTDASTRRRALERLVRPPCSFGLEQPKKGFSGETDCLFYKRILSWPEEGEVEDDRLQSRVTAELDRVWLQLTGSTEALREIFQAPNAVAGSPRAE